MREVPPEKRRRWEMLINTYILTRKSLRGLILITDARRPLGCLDQQLLAWTTRLERPVHVLVSKADKLNARDAAAALAATQRLADTYSRCTVQLFSATKGIGVQAARTAVASMLDAK